MPLVQNENTPEVVSVVVQRQEGDVGTGIRDELTQSTSHPPSPLSTADDVSEMTGVAFETMILPARSFVRLP